MGRKQRRARYLAREASRLESPGTPPMKLSDAEEEDLEEAADPLCAQPAPARPTHVMSSASVMHRPQDHHPSLVHVHLCPPDGNLESRGTPLQENPGTPLEEADAHEQFSQLGRGLGSAGLWSREKRRPRGTEQSSCGVPWGPRSGNLISVLHLEAARARHNKAVSGTQGHNQRSLATVNELTTVEFPGRIKNSKLEPWKVSSDSGSSVASSDAAL